MQLEINVAGYKPEDLKVKTDDYYLYIYSKDDLIRKYWIYPRAEVENVDYQYGMIIITFKDGMREIPITSIS